MPESNLDLVKLILALGFGGILTIVTIVLFHLGYLGWGLLCLGAVFLVWLFDNEISSRVISVILLVGGLIEIAIFNKVLLGIILIILALAAFFVPRLIQHDII